MQGGGVISITVKCDLAYSQAAGRVHLRLGVDRTLDSLLDEFCSHMRIRRLPTLSLRNDLHSELALDLTLAAAGLSDGDVIYAFDSDPPPPPPEPVLARDSASNWWILAAAALAIGLFGAAAIITMFIIGNQPIDAYGVIIDAGSSSSKVYIYTWPASKTNGNGVVSQRAVANNSSAPIESSQGINQIEWSLRSLDSVVPEDRKAKTELFLGATAGMRMYSAVNSTAAELVLNGARQVLTSKFAYKVSNATGQIRIITGAEEAVGAWISVYYLKNSFGDFASSSLTSRVARSVGYRQLANDFDTFGSLDLGGASTQIAFVPAGNFTPADSVSSKTHIVPLSLYGKVYNVYAYSFLCYGKAEAENRMLASVIANAGYNSSAVINTPCWQADYTATVRATDVFQRPCSDRWQLQPPPPPPSVLARLNFTIRGTGSYENCSKLVGKFFNATCDQSTCSFNDVFQPAPAGKFVAFSGFYYVASFFNASNIGSDRMQFVNAVRAFCQKRYVASIGYSDSFLRWYCFDGVYVLSLLNAYGFNETNWGLLEFEDSITVNHSTSAGEQATSANKVGWSLGYTILQSGLIPAESPLMSLSLPCLSFC
ncbi:hypothetical protein BOX15_Mlig026231g1 [Macrostomum lignano]|uniref:Uncharacterized protein n=1 Tax=Macrostomum lignano TaxID=282301 RepID=A0A267G6B0_9PLAT|nr:hypothetical protein BOX15_Mlig026231g1 [Macrostomum lignano]